ncbi:MAG: quercetin 2,3-dioxygenase [Blastococcus sp.]|nr:quercetin 2,3-dioxygenase [Blastococcus sp.]
MSGLHQRLLLAPDDGSLGPLLRVSDDRLAPGAGYGRHAHRAVDVVAVVLTGSLQHRWGSGKHLGPGDVAVLRAGAGLEHDEVAGDDGARVLQCYLRAARPDLPPAHEVHRHPSGWIDLDRDDARVWVAGGAVDAPPGTGIPLDGSDLRVVWELAAERPEWARI